MRWPIGRVLLVVFGCLALLGSMALFYGALGLFLMSASFSDSPGVGIPDLGGWILGGVACLAVSAILFRLSRRSARDHRR